MPCAQRPVAIWSQVNGLVVKVAHAFAAQAQRAQRQWEAPLQGRGGAAGLMVEAGEIHDGYCI